MKKTLIALAAVAAVSASFAQSTVYGVADAYVGKSNIAANGANTSVGTALSGGGMSGARLGFTASEDLGSGMSATVKYETGVGIDAATATSLGNRVGTLALASGANSLTLGTQYTPSLNYIACNSAIGCHNQDVSGTNVTVRSGNSVSYGYNAAPFSVLLMGAFKEDGTNDGANAGLFTGLGGTYTAGALVIGAAIESSSVATAGATASNLTGLSATYDFGVFKLGGIATSLRNAGNLDGSNRAGLGLQLALPLGANNVHFSYATNAASGAASSSNTVSFSGLFSHSLSKTTNVYAFYNQSAQDANAGLYAGGTANATTTTMGLGARKSF